MKRKTYRPVACQKHTRKQVVVEYLNVWFRETIPITKKRITKFSLYLSSNSFASLLSQTSNLVHNSLVPPFHLVTQVYQPRQVYALSVSCQ